MARVPLKERTAESEAVEREASEPRALRYLPRTFDSLRFGPFRWYMGALIWWNAAMSMQMLVRGYLTYDLTGSFAALGIVGLGSAIPMLFLSPVGGVIADRSSRRVVLQIGQAFSLVIAVTVALLVFTGVIHFWHLFVAAIAQGTMMALVMPSRQALLPEVVGLRRLVNAIPLQSASMNLMQIIGPAIGGFMIDWIGSGSVYLLMAVMYGMSVLLLFFVHSLSLEDQEAEATNDAARRSFRRARAGRRGSGASAFGDLLSGLKYLRHNPILFSVISFAFLGSVLGMPIRRMLPGYVADVFSDSGSALGLISMGMGIGALAGALILATLNLSRRRGLIFAGTAVTMGVGLLLFSLTGIFWFAFLSMMAVGIGSTGRQALSQMLIQDYVDEEYRGRVMAVYMMQISMMNVGAFLVSLYMDLVGPQVAVGSLGVMLLITTGLFITFVPRFRTLD